MFGNNKPPRLTSVEALEKWFFRQPEDWVYWVVYSGFGSKKVTNQIQSNIHVDDRQQSWEFLKETVIEQSYQIGQFTIFIRKKPKDQYGNQTKLELIPESMMHQPDQPNGLQVAGYGYPRQQIGMMPLHMNYQQMLAQERRMWELEQSNKDLSDALDFIQEQKEQKKSFKEKLTDKIASDPMQMLDKAIGLLTLMNLPKGQPAPVGVQGIKPNPTKEVIPKPDNPQDTDDETNTEATEDNIDYDKVNAAMDELEKMGIKVDVVIPIMARVAQSNPEKVKALLEDESKLLGLTSLL